MSYIFFVFLGSYAEVGAQNLYSIGFLPNFNLNKGLPRHFALNLKAESRQVISTGEFSKEPNIKYEYTLTDFSIMLSKKIGLSNVIAGGYLIRLEGSEVSHRTIQQLSVISKLQSVRLGHRFVADETFSSQEAFELRLRYRIAAEFPLNGTQINPGESYFKLNSEFLNSFQENNYDIEWRCSPLFGYVFSDNNKLEYGLDYRLGSLLQTGSESDFWFTVNWYVKL